MRRGPLLVGMAVTVWVAPFPAVPGVTAQRDRCVALAPIRRAVPSGWSPAGPSGRARCAERRSGDRNEAGRATTVGWAQRSGEHRHRRRSRTEARLGLPGYVEGFHDVVATLPRAFAPRPRPPHGPDVPTPEYPLTKRP